MHIPLLDLKAQYNTIRSEVLTTIHEVLDSQHFILGPKVVSFEEQVAAYSDCGYGVGVSSGTDALLISLMAEGIGPGDEVITTPYSFFATAGAILRTGAKPVFVDIETQTYNIDPNLIDKRISSKTRAIVPVHLYGQCADMDPILDIARVHDLVVIEDAAQAIGAEYLSDSFSPAAVRRAGSMGDYGCLSFFPSKNLGGFGDGGMVVTNDPERAELLRVLRVHGSKPKYYHKKVGGNFRLDALQAAILSVKLKHLDSWTVTRQRNAAYYDDAFASSPLLEKGLISPPKAIWGENSLRVDLKRKPNKEQNSFHYHIWNQYVIKTPRRDKLKAYLLDKGIGTEVYYPLPLHLQECFTDLGLGQELNSFPAAEEAAKQTLSLPIYPELTTEQQDYVIDSIQQFFLK